MIPPTSLRFSHVGLFCIEIEPMMKFYTEVLGFLVTDRGNLPNAEACFMSRNPDEHHELVLVTGRPPGLPNLIVNQISFRLDTLADLKALWSSLPRDLVSDLDPVLHGVAWSLYFRDPEGNRLEVFVDSDWYIDQPVKERLDLDLDEDEIRSKTLAFCRDKPGFKPMHAWKQQMADRISTQLEQISSASMEVAR